MLQVTDNAVKKVKELMAREAKEGYGLRVAVQGGGCSGFQYGLSYEEEQKEDDRVYEYDGLKVFVDKVSDSFLEEVTVDYVDSLTASGFKIENAKATGSCGCGASFSV
jgi:iron-sulfur cluster assembly accessory protein